MTTEPELRVIIQTLTKRLTSEFESVDAPEERMRLVLKQPEMGPQLASDLGIGTGGGGHRTSSTSDSWPRKNEEVAKRNREDGNAAFTTGNHELAITLYTEALKYASVHETLWEGETMAIAAANRYTKI